MPGPEDYPYTHEDDQPAPTLQDDRVGVEVSQADSNPAYYPAEAKSEALRTEDEKKALKEAEEGSGSDDVVNGQGETVLTAKEAQPDEPGTEKGTSNKSPDEAEVKKTVPKAKAKD